MKKGILKSESQAKYDGTIKWDEKTIEYPIFHILPFFSLENMTKKEANTPK
jgi:hypothetical protein